MKCAGVQPAGRPCSVGASSEAVSTTMSRPATEALTAPGAGGMRGAPPVWYGMGGRRALERGRGLSGTGELAEKRERDGMGVRAGSRSSLRHLTNRVKRRASEAKRVLLNAWLGGGPWTAAMRPEGCWGVGGPDGCPVHWVEPGLGLRLEECLGA